MRVTVLVDDFGASYSSLSCLTRFPIDKIKINRTFARGLATDATDAAVVNVIIAVARGLDIRVVAEGVETERRWTHLAEHGCDEARTSYIAGLKLRQTSPH